MFRIENPSAGKVTDRPTLEAAMAEAKKRGGKECGQIGIYSISKLHGIVRYEDTYPVWTSEWKPCPPRRRRRR